MKTFSFSDIKLASWLQGYSEVDMLSIDMDEKVNRVLKELGGDLDYPVEYYPAYHRNMQGITRVGFVACCETSHNRKDLSGPFTTLTDILVVAAHRDSSLSQELGTLTGLSRNYSPATEAGFDEHSDNYMAEQLSSMSKLERADWEANRKDIMKQVAALEKVRDSIRGSQFSESGSLKTPEQYQQYAAQLKGI